MQVEECEVCAGTLDVDDPIDPRELIANLQPGDIFHASARSTASFILLVTEVSEGHISARRVSTQDDFEFSLETGGATQPEESCGNLWIDCVEPLPIEHHNALVQMDRRYRLGRTFGRARLKQDEIAALLYFTDHCANYGFDEFAPGGGEPK